jgi:hypothetical protein
MRRLIAVALLGTAAVASAAPEEKPKILTLAPKQGTRLPPHEQLSVQTKAELTAVYETLAAAVEKGDVDTYLRARRPEYTEIAADGTTLDARGAAKALTAWIEGLRRPAKVAYGVGKVDLQQDAVTAMIGRRVTTREVIDGKSVEVEVVTQRLETWLRGTEGWRLRHAGAESVVQRLVDGNVVSEK